MCQPGQKLTLTALACVLLLPADGCDGTMGVGSSSGGGTSSAGGTSSTSAQGGASSTSASGGGCASGTTPCDGSCVVLTTDALNCGACGNVCNVANAATDGCSGGSCVALACDSGWTLCAGACVNTPNDPSNCGACGTACQPGWLCMEGLCGCECPKGAAMCPGDTQCCETKLGTNKNCAFCGDVCNLPNANSQCSTMNGNGVCNLISCNPGFANCDMIAANGCEVDTGTDTANCGACGHACAQGQTCVGGMCQ